MQARLHPQRGVSIIEVMVAFLILSAGLLAFARIQSELRYGAEISRQRAEAVRLAQENMEQLRAFSVLPTTTATGITSFDGSIAATSAAQTLTLADVNATFQLTRNVNTVNASTGSALYKALQVRVEWADRRGATQNVTLNSLISRLDPRENGKVNLTPPARAAAKSPLDRDVRIPIQAVDLGNRKSGFVPPGQSDHFWVFDSDSADIVKRCAFPNGSSTALNASVYANATCTSRPGYLLKGFVRFDVENNPSPIIPGNTACDFYLDVTTATGAMVLAMRANNNGGGGGGNDNGGGGGGGSTPSCPTSPTDLLGVTVTLLDGTGYSPGTGQPSFECFDDFREAVIANRGYVNYYCAVYVENAGDTWTGISRLTNTNAWSFGTSSTTYRNCRYSADNSGNNQIDPWEHPYKYSSVDESLTGQNFLLVAGNQSCPSDTDNIGNTGLDVDYRTCKHQPDPTNTSQTPTEAAASCEQ